MAVLTAVAAAILPADASASSTDRIAFTRHLPGGGANIYVTSPDGSQQALVPAPYPTDDWAAPHWSPDGQRLLISKAVQLRGRAGGRSRAAGL